MKSQKPYNGRDYLKIKIIAGVTKAGTHKDKRKEADRKACKSKSDVLKDY